ncbi:hypothetical protein BGX38DRAFT_237003 [Terfezia claveryi]|nr:hypothetical protein BGX38DRAFT_237003 [Terfezia claveryi]
MKNRKILVRLSRPVLGRWVLTRLVVRMSGVAGILIGPYIIPLTFFTLPSSISLFNSSFLTTQTSSLQRSAYLYSTFKSRLCPPSFKLSLLIFRSSFRTLLTSKPHPVRSIKPFSTSIRMDQGYSTGGYGSAQTPRGCYNCGESGHQARECPKRGTPVW